MRSTLLVIGTYIVAVAAFPKPEIVSVPYIPRNVVSVPDNCPSGQELVNGQCRDIWHVRVAESPGVDTNNVISVPPNCPSGQEYINGQCRDVWRNAHFQVALPTTAVNVVDNFNTVTVPDNCPSGQELVNGQCRDIWRSATRDAENSNVISVPDNCPSGQEYINGQCRDVWRNERVQVAVLTDVVHSNNPAAVKNADNLNTITVPDNCPSGQELVNGQCRDIWRESTTDVENSNVISVPDNCPSGQEYINGQCRDVWRNSILTESVETTTDSAKNVITVPDNCPEGQEYINGQCRDVWILKALKVLQRNFSEAKKIEEILKNIVQVPNQCPEGYKPDSAGVCREIW